MRTLLGTSFLLFSGVTTKDLYFFYFLLILVIQIVVVVVFCVYILTGLVHSGRNNRI